MFTRWRPRGLGGRAVGLGRQKGAQGVPGGGEASCAVPAGETSGVYPGATPLV